MSNHGSASATPPGAEPGVIALVTSASESDELRNLLAPLAARSDVVVVISPPHPLPAHERPGWLRAVEGSCAVPVVEVGGGERLHPARVVVGPAGLVVSELDGALCAEPLLERGNAAEALLSSVAEHAGARGIGVLLSAARPAAGRGVAALQERGGVVVGTPQVATEVDRRLPALELARFLVAHLDRRRDGGETLTALLPAVCEAVRGVTGHDFSHYRESTLQRRLARRLQILQADSPESYLAYLEQTPAEARALTSDFLIGVTSFFRDAGAFEALATEALRPLIEGGNPRLPLRLWAAGCSTGEEAYTLAMLLTEQMEALGVQREVQIFATDIHRRALELARQGLFSSRALARLSPQRRERFFLTRGERVYVTKQLREMCLFAVHDLLRDAPFPRLDLITCRNVLIYLKPGPQKRLLSVLHYALRPEGYLFLGPSETIGEQRELFRAVNPTHRILQRRVGSAAPSDLWRGLGSAPPSLFDADGARPDLRPVVERLVLDDLAPRYAVVDEHGELSVASHGLGRFLEIPEGPFERSLGRLARPPLRLAVRSTLQRAVDSGLLATHDDVTLELDGEQRRVRVLARPLPEVGGMDRLFVVAFQELGPVSRTVEGGSRGAEAEALIEHLERELAAARAELERTLQDLEASNEELKSSNEELRSINEELHSANEELRASKEEVESSHEALGRAYADLENLLESHPVATIFLDEQLRIRSFTPAATAIYPLQPTDAGRPLEDLAHHARRMPPLPDVEALRAGRELGPEEIELHDGRRLLRKLSPYKNRAGQSEGVVVSFADVTGLRQREAALARREAELRLLVDSVPGLISYVGTDYRYAFVNRGYLERFERTQETTVGAHVREVLGEHAFAMAEPHLERAFRGERVSYQIEVPTPSGPRVMDAAYVPDADENGVVRGIFALVLDVTDAQRMERALQESESKHRVMLERISDAFLSVDAEGRYAYVNDAAERLLRRPREELLGKTLAEAYPEALGEGLEAGVTRARATGEPSSFETYSPRLGRWFEFRCYPAQDGVSVFFADSTERKVAERELAEARAEAEAASRAKSAFLANMSHELRTPMTAILGFADLLSARAPSMQSQRQLHTIKRNGEHLIQILNDILDLSRIEAGRLEVVRERFSLVELLQDVWQLMQVRAQEKRLPLELDYASPVPLHIHSDRTRLRQVLVNLVSNAIKFTDEGRVRIVAGVPRDDELELRVEDTGVGIAPERLESIFEAFAQGDPAQTSRGGTGLGLSISRRLAEMLGGSISVTSSLGRGSSFVVRVPIGGVSAHPFVDPRVQKVEPASHEPTLPPRIQGLEGRVLVADDQAEIREVLAEYLQAAGLEVALATNGLEALSWVERADDEGRPFAALLLDMQMPVLDGYEVVRQLRARGDKRPVLAVTAAAMKDDRARALEAGCDEHLTKPVDAHRLLEVLRARLAETAAGATAASPAPEGARTASPAEGSPAEGSPTEASPAEAESGVKVLLVDDSADLREVLSELLVESGHEVRVAGSGGEALEVTAGFRPDVAVVDLGLPDLHGTELVRRLRKQPALRRTRFVALSGRTDESSKRAARAAGFDVYLEKPVEMPELEAALLSTQELEPAE